MPLLPLRRLRAQPPGGDDRIAFFNTWYRGHNNARYSELLPRLERVDSYLLTFPRARALRIAAERSWGGVRGLAEPALLHRMERRYRYALVTDLDQLPALTVPCVVDVDDPRADTPQLLDRPNVAAYVVTDESVARRYEQLGVERPWHVVPQGVALDSLDESSVREVALRHREPGTCVVGYLSAYFLLPGDRGAANPLYNVEHLFELWDELSARDSSLRLWLVGGAGKQVQQRCAGRRDITLFGRVPREQLLSYVANFDIALYPRTADQGIRASKIAEYFGAGVPIVSYDYEVVGDVRSAGAGILVETPREFVAAVERLASDPAERLRLAAAARAVGRERDWRNLAARYAEILDEHLLRSSRTRLLAGLH